MYKLDTYIDYIGSLQPHQSPKERVCTFARWFSTTIDHARRITIWLDLMPMFLTDKVNSLLWTMTTKISPDIYWMFYMPPIQRI